MHIPYKIVAVLLVCAFFFSNQNVQAQEQKIQIDTVYFRSYRSANQRIIQSLTYRQDSVSKTVEEFYRSGTLRSRQEFKNDKLQGVQKYFFESGNKWKVLEYSNGFLLETSIWSANGNLSYRRSNIIIGNQVRSHGRYTEYYNSGQVRKMGVYDSGKMHKKWVEYYESGKKKSIKQYKRGHLEGKSILWNASGNKMGSYNYTYDKKKKKEVLHKKQVSYHKNGKIRSVEWYNKGAKEGLSKKWFPNGELESEVEYKNGSNYGKSNYYYSSGKPKRIMNYYNVLDSTQKYNRRIYYDGKYREYYENGNLKLEKNYKNELLEGAERSYFNNGNLKQEKSFNRGLNEGRSSSWNEDGALIYEENFRIYGLPDSLYSLKEGIHATYDKNGDTSRFGLYQFGKKEGVWRAWDKDDRLVSLVEYCDGLVCGISKKWEEGKLIFQGNYVVLTKEGINKSYAVGKHVSFRNGIREKLSVYNDSGIILRTSHYYPSGNLKEIYLHILPTKSKYNEMTTGRTYTFYENGVMRSSETQVNRRNAGLSKYYFMNGNPRTYKFWPVNFNDDKAITLDWDSKGGYIAFKEYDSYNSTQNLMDITLANKIFQHLMKTKRSAYFYDTFTFQSPLIETYFDNTIESKIHIGNSKKKGLVEMFHLNGASFLKVESTEGMANGDYRLNAANTYPIESGSYQFAKRTGLWKYYNAKDTLRQEMLYHDHTEQYFTKTDYYKNGAKKSVLTYKNGRQIGVALGYFDNGTLKWENHFQNGGLDSISKRYYVSGEKHYFTGYTLGRRNGKEEAWYPNGAKQFTQFYKNGKLDSFYVAYWKNGTPRNKGYYKNGVKDSLWLVYTESGNLKSQYTYKSGKMVSNYQKTACSCKEKVPKRMKFVPLLKHLTSLEEVHKLSFNYHAPIDNYYNSLFYKNLQFSNSSKFGFRSLTILSFDEAFIYLPNRNGLKLILNPCFRQPGTYSEIPATVSSEEGNKEALRVTLDPGRIALEFNSNLLRQWDSSSTTPNFIQSGSRRSYLGAKLFFDVSGITYDKAGYISLNNPNNICFTLSEIGSTGVKLKIHKATVNLDPDKGYYGSYYSSYSTDFFKYVKKVNGNRSSYSKVDINAVYSDSSALILPQSVFGGKEKDTMQVSNCQMLLSNHVVYGSFKISAELDNGLSYQIKVGGIDKVIPAHEIAAHLKKLGFSSTEVKYNNKTKTLMILFNYHM